MGSAERRLMEIIVSESNRLSKILEEFLRFVRPQERRVAPFDVGQNIKEVLELFRRSDEISDAHRIQDDIAPASSMLAGDRDQIRQIIYNVAKNAVRAMPDGGSLIVEGREDGAWYSIKFRDTGRGMSEEEIARVFTPFSTAFDGGTGLGMAIVRRIVEDHGGAIDVESKPGEGTTVTILLPRNVSARRELRAPCACLPRPCSERSADPHRRRREVAARHARPALPQAGLRGPRPPPTTPRASRPRSARTRT